MKKYVLIIWLTWAEMLEYRLNFVLWRVRWVLQRLVVYFLWGALFAARDTFFGYSQSLILTYVLLTNVIATFVMGTRTMEVGNIIRQGDLSNILTRPLHFFRVYIARDTADKLLNLAFGIGEVLLFIILLRPQIFVQTDTVSVVVSLVATVIGVVIFFYFSLIIGFLAFWLPDVWAPRFLSFVIMEFFTGALFPLDILPTPLFALAKLLPFGYLVYFPSKLYLGQLAVTDITSGMAVGLVWAAGLWYLATVVWKRGLRVYTSEGR